MTPRRWPGTVGAAALLTVVLSGCVAPAPTTSAYASKAVMSADAAVSAARTALLAEDAFVRDRLPAAYLETVVADSESALGSVQNAFDSVQPPGSADADALRAELDPLLDDAHASATDLRIAARRQARDELITSARALSHVADQLDAFAGEHAP